MPELAGKTVNEASRAACGDRPGPQGRGRPQGRSEGAGRADPRAGSAAGVDAPGGSAASGSGSAPGRVRRSCRRSSASRNARRSCGEQDGLELPVRRPRSDRSTIRRHVVVAQNPPPQEPVATRFRCSSTAASERRHLRHAGSDRRQRRSGGRSAARARLPRRGRRRPPVSGVPAGRRAAAEPAGRLSDCVRASRSRSRSAGERADRAVDPRRPTSPLSASDVAGAEARRRRSASTSTSWTATSCRTSPSARRSCERFESVATVPLDVHLMIEDPDRYIEAFVDAGAARYCGPRRSAAAPAPHASCSSRSSARRPASRSTRRRRSARSRRSPAIVDYVLVMSVNPGFGGQTFIPRSESKIAASAQLLDRARQPGADRGRRRHRRVECRPRRRRRRRRSSSPASRSSDSRIRRAAIRELPGRGDECGRRDDRRAARRSSTVRVRYAETDKMGVVYYANYFVWFEVGARRSAADARLEYREMEARGRLAAGHRGALRVPAGRRATTTSWRFGREDDCSRRFGWSLRTKSWLAATSGCGGVGAHDARGARSERAAVPAAGSGSGGVRMKALVTGAAGFIGSHLTTALLDRGADVDRHRLLHRLLPARHQGSQSWRSTPDAQVFSSSKARIQRRRSPALLDGETHVFHLAAQAGVRKSWGRDFRIYTDNNVDATQHLLEACVGRPLRAVRLRVELLGLRRQRQRFRCVRMRCRSRCRRTA